MKNLILCIFVLSILTSCVDSKKIDKPIIDNNDLASILNACKGHAYVIVKGYNSGKYESYRHYLIIRDDSLNTYEYHGAEFDVKVGQILK